MGLLTGTITAAGTTVTGTGTLFATELLVGDKIQASGNVVTIISIASNTSMVVSPSLTVTNSIFYEVFAYYGKPFESADMTGTTMYIRMRPNDDTVLKAIRTWVIFNNYSAALTGLQCKIYSDNASQTPGALIATSTNSFSKADIITETSGVKEIYFLFDEISLHTSTFYHFVLNASAYTYSSSAHIAWRHAWPDPVYRTNLPLTFESLAVSPFFLTVIGADL